MNDDALIARLERLERSARRDRAFALGALALFLVTAQAPAVTPPLLVSAPSGASARITPAGLIVHDTADKTRTAAWIDTEGRPSFDESDASGTLRQSMYLFKGSMNPELDQYDAQGKIRDELFLGGDAGYPEFEILDPAQTRRLAAFIGTGGNPELDVLGSDGKPRGYLETDDRLPFLVMKDKNQGIRAYLGAYTDGTLGIDVRDASNRVLFKKP